MAVVFDVVVFLAGLALLVAGAEGLIRGAVALASRFGMSKTTIGLTIVAVGTSAPEFVVGAVAAGQGDTDVVVGAVLGSNILNILVVLGATALIHPFFVQRETQRQDMPVVAFVSVGVFLLAIDRGIGRIDGLLLMGAMIGYLIHINRRERSLRTDDMSEVPDTASLAPWLGAVAFVVGCALLVIGADLVVDGGKGIAAHLGVPDRVVALTLVALGTSAPELATGLVAAARKQVDLAIGNVVGSNILNLLFVLGTASLIRPLPISQDILRSDLLIMVLVTFLMMMLLLTSSRRRMGRMTGAVLLAAYVVYVLGLFGVLQPVP